MFDKIELEQGTNEGYTYKKSDAELVQELVEKYNELIDYIERHA